jgi:hypothetical protein
MTFGVERVREKTSRKQEKHISWKASIYEGRYMKNVRKKYILHPISFLPRSASI